VSFWLWAWSKAFIEAGSGRLSNLKKKLAQELGKAELYNLKLHLPKSTGGNTRQIWGIFSKNQGALVHILPESESSSWFDATCEMRPLAHRLLVWSVAIGKGCPKIWAEAIACILRANGISLYFWKGGSHLARAKRRYVLAGWKDAGPAAPRRRSYATEPT